MTYQVIARKWRPQQFEDLVGQETTVRTLQAALRSGRIAHAYLFTGTRGVGKTSSARILAKALNCHRGRGPHPCDECPSCIEIARGGAVDVLEIDAASNRGINEIRELRETVQYAPARDRYKVFIIDEVHMLTTEAFNALLKTLEEPPAHVVFVLATTELHKIPQTILSRCQPYDFRTIPFGLIQDRLRRVLVSEGVELSDASLALLARASGGSMRDAESAIQKVVSLGGAVSDEDVAALLGVVEQDAVVDTLRAVLTPDPATLLAVVERVQDRGHDLQTFLRGCLEMLRHLAVHRACPDTPPDPALDPVARGALTELADLRPVEGWLRLYDLLLRADNDLRFSPFPRYHVELTLLKAASLAHLPPLEEVIQALRDVGTPPSRPAPPPPPGPPRAAPPPPRSAPPPPVAGQVTTPPTSAAPPAPPPARSASSAQAPAPAPSQAPAANPDAPAGPDTAAFVAEIHRKIPEMRAFLTKVTISLAPGRIEVFTTEGSLPDRTFRLPHSQRALIDTYRGLFGQAAEVVMHARPTAPASTPPTDAPQPTAPDLQDELERAFHQDAVVRVFLERLPGRWRFQRGPVEP